MTFKLSNRSLSRLVSVHPDLRAVIEKAIQITPVDFVVTEGIRSVDRQKELVAAGASKTMNSRHLTGHAVDLAALVGGKIVWNTAPYEAIAVAVRKAAADLDVKIQWGGDWVTFRDYVHFELDRQFYK